MKITKFQWNYVIFMNFMTFCDSGVPRNACPASPAQLKDLIARILGYHILISGEGGGRVSGQRFSSSHSSFVNYYVGNTSPTPSLRLSMVLKFPDFKCFDLLSKTNLPGFPPGILPGTRYSTGGRGSYPGFPPVSHPVATMIY